MKKIFLSFIILATAVACTSEGLEKAPAPMVTETISGTYCLSTKATIADGDASFKWSVGDNIAVHVSNGDSHKYVFTSGEGGASQAAASASFSVTYDSGYSRDAFAVYPSTIVAANASNYGQSGHTLDVTLPSTYTLAQVQGEQGETTPCPMIATNTASSTTWNFYQLCGLLRLTMNSIPPSTKRLEIDFDGKKVWGDFSIANPTPGTSSIATSDDDAHDIIKITNSGNTFYSGWGDNKVFNIPLPVGTYTNITVTAYNALSGGDAVLTVTRPFAYTATNEYGTKRTASFPVFSINTSRSKRVIFAPGNLQATTTDLGENWTWSFAEHQYDCLRNGGANTKITGNKTVSENGTVDLFCCSTEQIYYYGITNDDNNMYANNFTGEFVDWGTLDITYKGVTYPSGYWKLLTISTEATSDLGYMMRHRPTGVTVNSIANARFTQATINSDGTPVNGVIIFPDYYAGPTESTSDITWGDKINSYGSNPWPSWGGTSCTCKGWRTLESAGCAFLPAAGYRRGQVFYSDYNLYGSSFLDTWELNGTRYYWHVFHFLSTSSQYNTYWDKRYLRTWATAIRLAHEVQ